MHASAWKNAIKHVPRRSPDGRNFGMRRRRRYLRTTRVDALSLFAELVPEAACDGDRVLHGWDRLRRDIGTSPSAILVEQVGRRRLRSGGRPPDQVEHQVFKC